MLQETFLEYVEHSYMYLFIYLYPTVPKDQTKSRDSTTNVPPTSDDLGKVFLNYSSWNSGLLLFRGVFEHNIIWAGLVCLNENLLLFIVCLMILQVLRRRRKSGLLVLSSVSSLFLWWNTRWLVSYKLLSALCCRWWNVQTAHRLTSCAPM